jgi:hypothetical protein
MRLPGSAPLSLDERLPVDAALEEAFAPLRARAANIGPARIRAAVRWSAPEPRRLGGLGLLSRVSELTVAAAISAFLFAGAIAPIGALPAVPDVSRNAAIAGERLLNGRNALQRPMDSLATDYRTTADDVAANAATARRLSEAHAAPPVRDTEPYPDRP